MPSRTQTLVEAESSRLAADRFDPTTQRFNRSASTLSRYDVVDEDPEDKRPSTAPGSKLNLAEHHVNGDDTHDSSDADSAVVPHKRRPVKPLLLRSKSEHGTRLGESSETEPTEEEQHALGARHGFEDHYQSADIISQLANVGCLILLFPFLPRDSSPLGANCSPRRSGFGEWVGF
jgi:hypothetical protein